ncbi:MAG: Brp/Blh family beta-carotene 15,15'-dioxygenase [Bacteroidetes bacterium]|jgi:Brp/Blh family beta-carotene 15,15'-monooxygenase|nr:Brp/Blh family beta-carotene 15,15'-dioxygenase [Bacteroidota bacterium]MDF1867144.1 Brp/Blh family beta-carotene 15,15'-dioxygenase [Saprospiraceae bacterium]
MKLAFLNIIKQQAILYQVVPVLTVFIIILGLTLPKEAVEDFIIPFSLFFILMGIIHGASDFLVFQSIYNTENFNNQLLQFSIGYGLLTLSYLIIWYISPLLAFSFFILVSIYHFGEANWQYLKNVSASRKILTYFIWGIAVLGIPIILYFDDSQIIINEITQVKLSLTSNQKGIMIFVLCFANLVYITHLFDKEIISYSEFGREIRNFLLLIGLFFSTPLLIGFSIYFVFWHSLPSMNHQIISLSVLEDPNQRSKYVKQVVIITFISFAGLAGLYMVFEDTRDFGFNLGILFFFIAIITVPHSILMHLLYIYKNQDE